MQHGFISARRNLFLVSFVIILLNQNFTGIFLSIPKGIPQSTRLLLGTLGGCYIGYGMFDQLGRLGKVGSGPFVGVLDSSRSTRGLSIGDCVASACPPFVLLG